MTFAQRRNRLTTHFSERIPVVKRRISVFNGALSQLLCQSGRTLCVRKDLNHFQSLWYHLLCSCSHTAHLLPQTRYVIGL